MVPLGGTIARWNSDTGSLVPLDLANHCDLTFECQTQQDWGHLGMCTPLFY